MKRIQSTLRAALTILVAACLTMAAAPVMAGTPANMLIIANKIDDITSLDPASIFEFSGSEYATNVYDRLVTFDPHNLGPLQPGIAESWSVAQDGVTHTFKIKPGIKFHSGNPVTAADVEFSLHRAVILQKAPSIILTQFGFTKANVHETIKAVGANEVVIKTDKPYAQSFLLNGLTATVGSIVDKVLVMQHDKGGDMGHEWLQTHSAGSGAYSLKGWKPNESLVLDANKNFWRGSPSMKRVFIRHIEESATQRLMLEKGDVDIARQLLPDDIKKIQTNPALAVDNDLKGRIVYISLNQKDPILRNPKVSLAIKYLIDYEGMASSFLQGAYRVHQAFLPLTFLGELTENPFSLDMAKAKALLTEAGYPNGFEVTMLVHTQTHIAQSLQNTFSKAGIKVKLSVGTGKQILAVFRARQHQIYLGSWGSDYPDPHTNANVFANNPNNDDAAGLTGNLAWRNAWNIPELSKATLSALLEMDTSKRAAMYVAIQKEHQMNSPFAVMFQQIMQTARRKNVTGFITGSAVTDAAYWTVVK